MQLKYVLCSVLATVAGATYSSTRCSGGHCPATNPSDENLVLIQRQVSRHTNQACPPKPGTQCQGNDVLVPVWPPPYTSTAEECADLCSKNDKCQAYTFNNGPDGHQGLVEDATSGVCTAAATAVGDPHLVNTRGEHFSIFRSGQVEFIRVPYESVTEEADMTVHATIQSFGETDKCKEALYITGLRFGGSWFKGKPLEINFDFIRPGATKKEMKALLGSVPVVPSTDPIDVGDKMALHMHDNKKIVLMVDGASVVVEQRRTAGRGFLNVKADSFSKLSQKIGGLLGEDDHSAFSTKPAGCEHELVTKTAQPVSASMSA